MKPWKPFLALCCIALAASPAAASVLFRGLHYSPVGSSVVDVAQGGRLVVSNIGSSGQDGVSMSCLHMDGGRLSLDGSCSAADQGASVAFTFTVSVSGTPLSPRVRLGMVPTALSLDCSVPLNELSSSPTMTVTLSRGGLPVSTRALPRTEVVKVMWGATGSCPNPTLSCSVARDRASGQATGRRTHAAVTFSSVVHVVVAGEDEDCDDIEFSSAVDPADDDCDGDMCELRVSAPVGSSFSTVQCADGSCRVLDRFVSGDGAVDLAMSCASSCTSRRLEVHNLGSSGQDGVSVTRAPLSSDGSGGGGGGGGSAVECVFAPPSLLFDPATDVGSSAVITLIGHSFSSGVSSPSSARMKLDLAGGTLTGSLQVTCDHSATGAVVESVAVLSHGDVVGLYAITPGSFVTVTAPPGGPPVFAVSAFGKSHELTGHVTLIKAPALAVGAAIAPGTESVGDPGDPTVPMEVAFRTSPTFIVDASPPVVGDRLVCWGGSTCTATCADGYVASSTEMRVSCPSPSLSLSSLSLFSLSSGSGDQVFADVSSTTAITSTQTCVTVPFVFARTDATPMRAYSVTFHMSPELAQCGPSVVEGSYLSRVAGTQMFVTDNGGGSFTVDCSTLGGVCGATGSGTLFSVDFSAVLPALSDVGVITVDDVRARDCSNAPVVATPGGSSYLPIQLSSPTALSGLTATQVKSGNPAGDVTGVSLVWSPRSNLETVSVYARGFGNYPLYDKGGSAGHVPSPPLSSSVALSSGWRPVTCSSSCSSGACTSTCTSSSVLDSPSSRDYLYYVAFVRDLYGNESPVSNMTPGTLDYHLGDVSNGVALCSGDNHVDILDITALGSHYGRPVGQADAWTCLDVGPTLDYSVDTRPTVDGKVEFEDLILFAMNFSLVSAPSAATRPMAAAMNAAQLVVPALPAVGETFDAAVAVDGAGDVQGLSLRLAYDPSVIEQVGVASGDLLDQQGRPASVLSSGPGDVDAVLLGRGPGIAGHGEVARVTFRVKSAGDPQLAIASVTARSGENRTIAMAGSVGGATVPAHSALGFAYPNPFRQSLAFQLSLHTTGPASIGIYDVAGRRVRSLVQGTQSAGSRIVTWDGRDDAGIRLAPGAYIVRLESAGLRESRTVRLVR